LEEEVLPHDTDLLARFRFVPLKERYEVDEEWKEATVIGKDNERGDECL
jgi:hypothetical protein